MISKQNEWLNFEKWSRFCVSCGRSRHKTRLPANIELQIVKMLRQKTLSQSHTHTHTERSRRRIAWTRSTEISIGHHPPQGKTSVSIIYLIQRLGRKMKSIRNDIVGLAMTRITIWIGNFFSGANRAKATESGHGQFAIVWMNFFKSIWRARTKCLDWTTKTIRNAIRFHFVDRFVASSVLEAF